MMEPVALGPSKSKTAFLYVACVVFVVGGVFLIAEGGFNAVVGVVGIIFFGGGGVYAIKRGVGTKPCLILTAQGVQPMSGGLVPWGDIEAVGLGKLNSGTLTVVGIRLASYDAYLRSLPEQAKKESLAVALFGRSVGALMIPATFDASAVAQAIAEGDVKGAVHWDLLSLPHQDLAKQLLWARQQTGGYDLSWTGLNFAGRPSTVVATIEDYWRRTTQTR